MSAPEHEASELRLAVSAIALVCERAGRDAALSDAELLARVRDIAADALAFVRQCDEAAAARAREAAREEEELPLSPAERAHGREAVLADSLQHLETCARGLADAARVALAGHAADVEAEREAAHAEDELPPGYQRGPASGEILSDDVAGELARVRAMREAMREGRPPSGGER